MICPHCKEEMTFNKYRQKYYCDNCGYKSKVVENKKKKSSDGRLRQLND